MHLCNLCSGTAIFYKRKINVVEHFEENEYTKKIYEIFLFLVVRARKVTFYPKKHLTISNVVVEKYNKKQVPGE